MLWMVLMPLRYSEAARRTWEKYFKNCLGFLRQYSENNRTKITSRHCGIFCCWNFVIAGFKGLKEINCLHIHVSANLERLDGFDLATACGNTRRSQVHLLCSVDRFLVSAVTQSPLLLVCWAWEGAWQKGGVRCLFSLSD